MAYLRCPECRLTVPAHAYYLRGDQCPRCLTAMAPCARFRDATAVAKAATVAAVSGEGATLTARRTASG